MKITRSQGKKPGQEATFVAVCQRNNSTTTQARLAVEGNIFIRAGHAGKKQPSIVVCYISHVGVLGCWNTAARTNKFEYIS